MIQCHNSRASTNLTSPGRGSAEVWNTLISSLWVMYGFCMITRENDPKFAHPFGVTKCYP